MLDELLYVFLRALVFDGDDPLPLITEWNYTIARVQKVFDRMTDKDAKLEEVVRCRDCKHYDCEDGDLKCVKDAEWSEEDACYYGFISYHGPEFFCADGERKGGGKDE